MKRYRDIAAALRRFAVGGSAAEHVTGTVQPLDDDLFCARPPEPARHERRADSGPAARVRRRVAGRSDW